MSTAKLIGFRALQDIRMSRLDLDVLRLGTAICLFDKFIYGNLSGSLFAHIKLNAKQRFSHNHKTHQLGLNTAEYKNQAKYYTHAMVVKKLPPYIVVFFQFVCLLCRIVQLLVVYVCITGCFLILMFVILINAAFT